MDHNACKGAKTDLNGRLCSLVNCAFLTQSRMTLTITPFFSVNTFYCVKPGLSLTVFCLRLFF